MIIIIVIVKDMDNENSFVTNLYRAFTVTDVLGTFCTISCSILKILCTRAYHPILHIRKLRLREMEFAHRNNKLAVNRGYSLNYV